MKREWKTPDIQDLTISSTSTTSMQTCFWWKPGRPGRPGHGGHGGHGQSPEEFHPTTPEGPDDSTERLS